MDNICHTLVGAALAESGLKRRTPLATATLVVGANLPDLDAAAYAWGNLAALEFRRGWTHGVLAMAVLPVALALVMVVWDRLVRRRGGVNRLRDPARFGPLLLLSVIGVLSHPLLDLLNTYGVRLLMPFDGTWFHGDALFIVDPWMWLILGAGVILARRLARKHVSAVPAANPARVALGAVTIYALTMTALGWQTRVRLQAQLAAQGSGGEVLMAAPVPVSPFRREVVVRDGDSYERGSVRAWDAAGWSPSERVAVNGAGAAGEAAVSTADGRRFLGWSRIPYSEAVPHGAADPALVRISDLRYSSPGVPSWASVEVPVR